MRGECINHLKPNKHDRYVLELVEQLKTCDYDDISTHLRLEREGRMIGEVDVLARKGDEIHLFEVKCSHRPIKARKQLARVRKNFSDHQTKCFFYCGLGRSLTELY